MANPIQQKQGQAKPGTAPVAAKPAVASGNGGGTAKQSTEGKSLLDQIRDKVNSLSADEVREQLAKLKAQRERQKEYHANNKREMTPEQRVAQRERNKERNARPEVKEKMKAYREKPEVKAQMSERNKARREMQKAILAKAAEMGITA